MLGIHAINRATRSLNWGADEGKLRQHHRHRLPRLYNVDRSEIVWTPNDRQRIDDTAPDRIKRLLMVACETALRPGDLIRLSRGHVEATPKGRRVAIRTNKRKRPAVIPIAPGSAAVIDVTPSGRALLLASSRGKPLTEHRASKGLRQWCDKAGLIPDALGYDLPLQDAHGTSATRLLNAGLSLSDIARHMGWSLRHAAAVIERYARVSPEETDAILVKLVVAKSGAA